MIAGDGQSEIAIEGLKRRCGDYVTKDDLTTEAFRRATINALQKSRPSIGIETQDLKRQQTEAVLQRFSTECVQKIKPVVSRMMRPWRDLRDATDTVPDRTAEQHHRKELSCMHLWDFPNDFGDYEGTDISKTPLPAIGRRTERASPVPPPYQHNKPHAALHAAHHRAPKPKCCPSVWSPPARKNTSGGATGDRRATSALNACKGVQSLIGCSAAAPSDHSDALSASIRSVFSQLKPPSASGVRPKCP